MQRELTVNRSPIHESVAGMPAILEIVERLVAVSSAELDRSALRSALDQVARVWPGHPVEQWPKWVAEAGESIGLRMKVVEASLEEALELVEGGVPVVMQTGESSESWLLLRETRRRRVCLQRIPGTDAVHWLTRRQLTGEFERPDATVPHRCIALEPNLAVEAASRDSSGNGSEPTPLQRLYGLLRPEWSDLWMVILFALFAGILALATPIAVEALVNTVAFGRFLQPVVVLAVILFGFLALAGGMKAAQTWVVEIIQRRLFARVAGDLAYRLPRLQAAAMDGAYGPELVNRFFDVVTVQKVAAHLLLDGVAIVLTTVIGMAVLAFYHPWLLGYDVLLLALIAVVIFGLGRGAIPSAVRESKTKYQVAHWLEELARCPGAFKLGGATEFATERADRLTADYLAARQAHFRILIRQILFALGLQALASTLLLGMGGWLVIDGQLTLGQLVAAELIVAYVVGGFAKLGKHLEGFYDLLAAVDKLGVLFDLPLERIQGLPTSTGTRGTELILRNVSYRYADSAGGLDKVEFALMPGERLGVTGPPGSGKTTLAALLYGARTPTTGHITLDGGDLRELRPDRLRLQVAVAGPTEIFDGTITENVAVQRPGISAEVVRHALESVELLDEILQLPRGLQTRISAGGPLTESQVRRLMLARAIAGQPRLLVVDGLLDACSDQLLPQLLDALFDRNAPWTLVVTTVRRDVLSRCDRVIELERSARENAGARAAMPAEAR